MSFPYVKQEKDNYCGLACVQMVLEYMDVNVLDVLNINIDVTGMDNEQVNLAKQNAIALKEKSPVNHIKGVITDETLDKWNQEMVTSPQEAVAMLQSFLDPLGTKENYWILYFAKENDPDNGPDAKQRFQTSLEFSMERFSLNTQSDKIPPPLVPIHGGAHWVVLFEYRKTEREEDKDLLREYIGHDPIYYNKKPSKKTVTNYSYAGVIHIACDEAKNFVNPETFLLISETDNDVFGKKGPELRLPPTVIVLPKKAPSVDAIREAALNALITYGFRKRGVANDHINGTSPSAPLLVSRLDQKNRKTPGDLDYYLIGMQDKAKNNYLLIRVDARSGRYLDSLGIPPTQYLLGSSAITKPRSELMNTVISQFPSNRRNVWATALENELRKTNSFGNNSPWLVWKPCFQSLSAFYPFYEITSGNETFYVRVDGAYFPRLTTVADT